MHNHARAQNCPAGREGLQHPTCNHQGRPRVSGEDVGGAAAPVRNRCPCGDAVARSGEAREAGLADDKDDLGAALEGDAARDSRRKGAARWRVAAAAARAGDAEGVGAGQRHCPRLEGTNITWNCFQLPEADCILEKSTPNLLIRHVKAILD